MFTPTQLITIIFFGSWLILFMAGRYQFNQLVKFTTALVQERVGPALEHNNNLTVGDYYGMIRPEWEKFVTSRIKFLPHSTELFPMPARVDYVVRRINFSPLWVGAYLRYNGIKLIANEEQQEQIEQMLARFPRKKNSI